MPSGIANTMLFSFQNIVIEYLDGAVGKSVYKKIRILCGQKGCDVLALNVQFDHVHLVFMVPPKFSLSEINWNGEREGGDGCF